MILVAHAKDDFHHAILSRPTDSGDAVFEPEFVADKISDPDSF